jgi:hypothetical protein
MGKKVAVSRAADENRGRAQTCLCFAACTNEITASHNFIRQWEEATFDMIGASKRRRTTGQSSDP